VTNTLKFASEPTGVTVTCGATVNVFVKEYVSSSAPPKLCEIDSITADAKVFSVGEVYRIVG
jgi:hypothetical protein